MLDPDQAVVNNGYFITAGVEAADMKIIIWPVMTPIELLTERRTLYHGGVAGTASVLLKTFRGIRDEVCAFRRKTMTAVMS